MSLLIRVLQLALSLCPARSDVNCGADLKNSRPRVGEERIILLPLPIVSLPSARHRRRWFKSPVLYMYAPTLRARCELVSLDVRECRHSLRPIW